MLRKADEQRQRAEEQHERRRQENLRLKQMAKTGGATSLAQMAASAQERSSEFDEMNEGEDDVSDLHVHACRLTRLQECAWRKQAAGSKLHPTRTLRACMQLV